MQNAHIEDHTTVVATRGRVYIDVSKMGRAKTVLIIAAMWLLVACTQESGVDSADPTPIPPTSTQNPTATLTNTPNPPTVTSLPTKTPAPTATAPVEPTPTLTPTDVPIVDLIWAEGVEPVTELSGRHFAWSPTIDEIAYLDCGEIDEFYKADAPDFNPRSITPDDGPLVSCASSFGIIWQPNGQNLLFTSEAGFGNETLWILDRIGNALHLIDDASLMPHIRQWQNNDQFLYQSYAGGGHINIEIIDLVSGEIVRTLPITWGMHHGIGRNYAAATLNGNGSKFESSFVYSVLVDKYSDVGLRGRSEVEFPIQQSAIIAHKWIPNTDQLLVEHWGDAEYFSRSFNHFELINNVDLERDVYLWDVASNEATLLAEGVQDISLQPTGERLAVTVATPVTQTQILDIATQNIIDTFEGDSLVAPKWLNDTHILTDGIIRNTQTGVETFIASASSMPSKQGIIRNVQTGAEIAIIEQPATGYNYSDYAVSQSGEYMSVKECNDDGCKTHILKVTLP